MQSCRSWRVNVCLSSLQLNDDVSVSDYSQRTLKLNPNHHLCDVTKGNDICKKESGSSGRQTTTHTETDDAKGPSTLQF